MITLPLWAELGAGWRDRECLFLVELNFILDCSHFGLQVPLTLSTREAGQ